MKQPQKTDIVISTAGRDKGICFLVLEREEEYVFLADGRLRRAEHPKRKKLRHVRFVAASDSRAAQKLREGTAPTNSELRRALSEICPGADEAVSRGDLLAKR